MSGMYTMNDGTATGFISNLNRKGKIKKMKKSTNITLVMAALFSLGGIAVADSYAESTSPNKMAHTDQKCDDLSTNQCDHRMGHHYKERGYGMKERLNLTEQQRISFREIKKKYFGESESEFKQLWQLKKELSEESLKKNTDNKKIDVLADAIGKQHTRLALLKSRFLKEVATVLTPEQIQRFLKMREMRFHGGDFRK